jgi:hypothetical protein
MDKEDLKEFTVIMTELSELYSKECTTVILTKYFNYLSNMSIEELRIAVDRHIRTSQFFPKIADLLTVNDISIIDRSKIAWNKVLILKDQWWTNKKTMIPDGAIIYAINKMGGICGRLANIDKYSMTSEMGIFESIYKVGYLENLHKKCGYIQGPIDAFYEYDQAYKIEHFLIRQCWDEKEIILYQNELEEFLPGKWKIALGFDQPKQLVKKNDLKLEYNEPPNPKNLEIINKTIKSIVKAIKN